MISCRIRRERCGRLEAQCASRRRTANTQDRLDRVRVELGRHNQLLREVRQTSESHEAATKRQEKAHNAVLQQLKDQEAESKGHAMHSNQCAEKQLRLVVDTLLEESRNRLHRLIEGGPDDGSRILDGEGGEAKVCAMRAARVAPLQKLLLKS